MSKSTAKDYGAKPWDRGPDEGPKAFVAFKIYLDLGEDRSLEAVRAKLGVSSRLIARWSSNHRWVARVELHRAHLDQIRRDAEEKSEVASAEVWAERREKAKQDEFAIGQQLLQRARDMLAYPLTVRTAKGPNGEHVTINPTRWGVADALRAAEVGAKLTRLSTGLATERTELSGPDGQPIQAADTVFIVMPDNGRAVTPPAAEPPNG